MNQNYQTGDTFVPTTEAEFNSLVDQVSEQFEFKDKRHVAAVIAATIRHLPNDQATVTIQYLGACVRKNMANFIANIQSQKLRHEGEVEVLANKLATNPLDQQAYDELHKMAQDGSPLAKQVITQFDNKEPSGTGDNVVPLQGA